MLQRSQGWSKGPQWRLKLSPWVPGSLWRAADVSGAFHRVSAGSLKSVVLGDARVRFREPFGVSEALQVD